MENPFTIPIPINLDYQETERLRFRKLRLEDIEKLLPFFYSAEAMKFLISETTPEETARSWILRQLGRYETNNSGLYALELKASEDIVGMCGLLVQDVDNLTELEIGYHLLPNYWKHGYATEAAKFCKQFAKENKLAESIISIIHINNTNSQKVAESNGLVREKQTTFRGFPVYIYRAEL